MPSEINIAALPTVTKREKPKVNGAVATPKRPNPVLIPNFHLAFV